jgi:hypothetical protein
MLEITAGTILLSIALSLAWAVLTARPISGIPEAVPAWKQLAEARGWVCSEPMGAAVFQHTPVIEVEAHPVRVRAQMVDHDGTARTLVRASAPGRPVRLTELPERPDLQVRAGPGFVEVSWAGVERDARAVEMTVDALLRAWS